MNELSETANSIAPQIEAIRQAERWPFGVRVAILGKLGAMPRAVAAAAIRVRGGSLVERGTREAQCVVLGADAGTQATNKIDRETAAAIDAGDVELIGETEFWCRLGLDRDAGERQLYTPRMLADLLDVPLRTVRHWIRLGLLHPVRVHYRLPYFDFDTLRCAKQLKSWCEAGLSADSIKRQLRRLLLGVSQSGSTSLDCWDIHLEGTSLLVRASSGWVDAAGQLRMDFEGSTAAADPHPEDGGAEDGGVATISIDAFRGLQSTADSREELEQEELLQLAEQAEDMGDLEEAVRWFRVLLTRFGATPEWHFALAELLYRLGDLSAARERYYAALEIDAEFIEARAALGCVLLDTGQSDLAIAAFQGVLQQKDDFADVHYHLARTLDDAGRGTEAVEHWEKFLTLAPHSPWAGEAADRLEGEAEPRLPHGDA